jgi:hypothetical protein
MPEFYFKFIFLQNKFFPAQIFLLYSEKGNFGGKITLLKSEITLKEGYSFEPKYIFCQKRFFFGTCK